MTTAPSRAKALLQAGQLTAAIAEVTQEVKAHPADFQPRTFLFELLCFAGEYDRAERQLEVIAHQNTSTELGTLVYRNVLAAERARQQLWSDGLAPHFLFDPPGYAMWHLEALSRIREGRFEDAKGMLEQSEATRNDLAGRLDGQPFSSFSDADDLLGPFLEIIVQNRYVWLPLEQIKAIEVSAPQTLRDLLWTRAKIEARTEAIGDVVIPVVYAGTSAHAEDQVRLGRMTEWKALAEGIYRGFGQRLYLVDGTDRPVLEMRNIEFTAEGESV